MLRSIGRIFFILLVGEHHKASIPARARSPSWIRHLALPGALNLSFVCHGSSTFSRNLVAAYAGLTGLALSYCALLFLFEAPFSSFTRSGFPLSRALAQPMGNAPGQLGHGGQLDTTSVWGLRWTPEERNYYQGQEAGVFAPAGQVSLSPPSAPTPTCLRCRRPRAFFGYVLLDDGQ